MSSLIDTYLEDLGQRLSPHVSPEKRDEILMELRSHLLMSRRAAIEELELSEEEADTIALRLMGFSELLAEDLVRRESGVESKPAWRLALLPMGLFALAQIVPWVFSTRGSYELFWISDWLNYGSLLAFVWAVWRSRRWLIAPIAVVLTVCVAGVFLTMMLAPPAIWFGVSKGEALAGYRRQIVEATEQIRAGELAMKGDLSAVGTGDGFAAPELGTIQNSFSLPYLPFAIRGGDSAWYGRGTQPAAAAAQEKWKAHGAGYLAQLKEQIRNDKQGIELLSNTGAPKPGDFNLSIFVVTFAYQMLVLASVNTGVLALSNRWRRKKADLRLTT